MDQPHNDENSEQDVASDIAVAAEGRAHDEDGDIPLVGQPNHQTPPAVAAPIFVEATGRRVTARIDDRLVNQGSNSTSISMRNMLQHRDRDQSSIRLHSRVPIPLQYHVDDGNPFRNRARFHATQQQRRDHHSRTQVTRSNYERRPPPLQVPASHGTVPSSIITNPASLRRYRKGIHRAAQSVQREFAQQVSRQLEALEKTFQEAVQHSDPELHHDILDEAATSNQPQHTSTSRLDQRSSSNLRISSNCQTRIVSGYDGDNDDDDDDTSDGDKEAAQRKCSE